MAPETCWKTALHELGQPAQRRVSVYAPWPRLCTHIHVTQRCTILMLQLPSTFTANTTGMPHPAGMTCLGFQRPPLLKWKNTSRILKHTSQNKGSKVGAEVLHTMKPRAAMSRLSLQERWKQAPAAKDTQFDVEWKRTNAREYKQKEF